MHTFADDAMPAWLNLAGRQFALNYMLLVMLIVFLWTLTIFGLQHEGFHLGQGSVLPQPLILRL